MAQRSPWGNQSCCGIQLAWTEPNTASATWRAQDAGIIAVDSDCTGADGLLLQEKDTVEAVTRREYSG
jgi:hypothetical protein